MKSFQNVPIQRKQTLIILLTTGVALLLACAAFGTYEVLTFRKSMLQSLTTLAEAAVNLAAAA